MKKNSILTIICLASAVIFSSCVDKIQQIKVTSVASNHIIFGADIENDIVITRSGNSSKEYSQQEERSLVSEGGETSLPLIVQVEQGIHRLPGLETKASITEDQDYITSLDAWATYTKYQDGQPTDESRLYFKTDGSGALFTKNVTDGIFYPHNNGPYLWISEGKFNFITVAPENSGFVANLNDARNRVVSFDYTVPADAVDQKDILVAYPDSVVSDFGQSVPLKFKHVMAAVNVKVGTVPDGIIRSVKFKGVYNKGTYLPNHHTWTNRTINNGGEFSVNMPAGGVTVGASSIGTTLTTGEAGFMMIPQQLFTGSEIEVVFYDNLSNKEHTLRASIQGDVWDMNTTTNYWINIDGSYNLQIVPIDKVLDSHYIITRVEVSSDYPIWQLYASANDGAPVTVQKEEEVNSMARLGFWTDKVASKDANGNYYIASNAASARGEGNCSGGQQTGQIVYVFIPENISDVTREITLRLIGTGGTGDMDQVAVKTLVLEQEPVQWMQDPNNSDSYWGCELLIEGGQVPWGFFFGDLTEDWRAYGKESNQPSGWWDKITEAMEAAGLDLEELMNGEGAIQIIHRNDHNTGYLLRIDYEKLGNIDVAKDYINGEQNTYELYKFDGINALASIKDFLIASSQAGNKGLEHVPGTFNGDAEKTLDYAAMFAMKRNRFHLYAEVINTDAGAITMYVPVIEDKDINWYLPAKDQFPYFINLNWGQAFSFNDLFWTSTAYLPEEIVDNAHAYAYINGVEAISHRNDPYLTFALRRYTQTGDIEIGDDNIIVPGEDGPEYGEGGTGGGDEGGNIGGGAQQ